MSRPSKKASYWTYASIALALWFASTGQHVAAVALVCGAWFAAGVGLICKAVEDKR